MRILPLAFAMPFTFPLAQYAARGNETYIDGVSQKRGKPKTSPGTSQRKKSCCPCLLTLQYLTPAKSADSQI
jgi:hypothetical protein